MGTLGIYQAIIIIQLIDIVVVIVVVIIVIITYLNHFCFQHCQFIFPIFL